MFNLGNVEHEVQIIVLLFSIVLLSSTNVIAVIITAERVFHLGNKEQEGQIIGGHEATPHSAPFQVALSGSPTGENQFCGGSLISLRYVLTGESNECLVILKIELTYH